MRCTALVMVMALSGCSFVFVKGPPPNHEQLPYFDCTESRAVPVLDTVFTLLQAANLLLAASTTDQQWADNFNGDPPIERSSAVPLYVVLAALGAGGMYYGFKNAGECRDAKTQAMARGWSPQTQPPYGQPPYAPQPYAPQPYAPQPYPPQPQPYAPQPYQPQPYQPQPYVPQPQPYAPQPQPYPPQPYAPQPQPQPQPYAPPGPPVAEPPAPPPPPPPSPQP